MHNLSRESATGMPLSARDQDVSDRGPGKKIYLAFIPWVLFTLVAQHSTLKAAAVAALVASIAIAVPSLSAGRPKLCAGRCIDTQTDPKNCGACGFDCAALPHGSCGCACKRE